MWYNGPGPPTPTSPPTPQASRSAFCPPLAPRSAPLARPRVLSRSPRLSAFWLWYCPASVARSWRHSLCVLSPPIPSRFSRSWAGPFIAHPDAIHHARDGPTPRHSSRQRAAGHSSRQAGRRAIHRVRGRGRPFIAPAHRQRPEEAGAATATAPAPGARPGQRGRQPVARGGASPTPTSPPTPQASTRGRPFIAPAHRQRPEEATRRL